MVANMRKRVLSLTLCLCMVLTLLPGTAFAADEIASGTCGANLTWTLDSGGTLRITGTGKMSNYSAEHYHKNDIPSEYGDDEIWVDGIWYYHITSPWFSHHKDIKHLVIEDGVTSIGKYAFCACESIQDVTMPTSLVNIGNLAFWSCSSISRIKIPDGVTHIGSQAFLQCKNLIRADVADSVTTIGDGAFSDCSQLYVVNIPQNLITLASGIFSDCTALEHIAIPNGITTISQLAFAGCSNLKSVNIPDSVTAIGERAFSDCTSLPSISIPDSVTTFFINNDGWIADDISHSPFSNCTSMTEIRVDANNPAYMAVDGILYNKERTILISYPAGKSESTFTVPGSVSDISWLAFSGASNLTQVVLPEGITEVGFYTFQNCTSLRSIIIPEGVTVLSFNAFKNCTSLESITIPKSVTYIDTSTFDNCKKLTIYCYKDSYTHQFAQNENIPYMLLDDPDKPSPEQKVSIRSASLTRDGATSDLLGRAAEFEYGSIETAQISVETDWGDGESGRIFLIQSRDKYIELPVTDIVPGRIFEPNRSVYVIATDADASKLLDWKETKLQIVQAALPGTPQIFISPKTLDLSIGKTEAVTVTTIPAGARYTLTSSGPEIVSVSGNTLTAHKLGRVEITATLADYPTVQAVCSVAVKEGYDDLMCAIAACQLSYEDELTRYGFGATVETFADAAIGPDRTLWDWAVWDAPLSDFYQDVLGDWKIVNVVSKPSGLFAVALDNAERNQRIIAFRGTESPKDVWADIEFAVLNKLPEQFSDAVDFYKRSIGDGRQILLTGHSLGGAIACYISLLTGERAELFNGANGRSEERRVGKECS